MKPTLGCLAVKNLENSHHTSVVGGINPKKLKNSKSWKLISKAKQALQYYIWANINVLIVDGRSKKVFFLFS